MSDKESLSLSPAISTRNPKPAFRKPSKPVPSTPASGLHPIVHNMISNPCGAFFATVALLIIYLGTSPASAANPIDPNGNLTAVKTDVNCFPPALTGSHLAEIRDCLQAALLLPEGTTEGTFHNGSPNDQFSLPTARVYQSCVATVSLPEGSVDTSFWEHIEHVVSQIAVICSVGQYPLGQTGGVSYIGKYNRIRVSIERAMR